MAIIIRERKIETRRKIKKRRIKIFLM